MGVGENLLPYGKKIKKTCQEMQCVFQETRQASMTVRVSNSKLIWISGLD
jgi:hypothetical protein